MLFRSEVAGAEVEEAAATAARRFADFGEGFERAYFVVIRAWLVSQYELIVMARKGSGERGRQEVERHVRRLV